MDTAPIRIEAVLFDADGVIQRPSQDRRRAWAEVLGRKSDVDRLLADVFAAEHRALDGHSSFVEALSQILTTWNCRGTLDEALRAWTMLEVDPGVIDVISALRQRGIRCYLATNQEPHRAQHMSETFGYKDVFDAEFYSCRLGIAKPDAAFFLAILNDIQVRPDRVLFLDDRQENVDAARSVGLHAIEFSLQAGLDALNHVLAEFGLRPPLSRPTQGPDG